MLNFKTNCWQYLFSEWTPPPPACRADFLWMSEIPRARDNRHGKNLINSLQKQEKAAIFNIEKFMVDGSICDDGSRMGVKGGLLQFISEI